MHRIIDFFLDPVLRGPMLGCMLMGLATALVGVVVLLQKRALVGEALSHAAYPGLAAAAVCSFGLVNKIAPLSMVLLLTGALISCAMAFLFLDFLEKKMLIPSDSALCFILSSFFGVGVLIVSYLQKSSSLWVKQIQLFLYGQPATMLDKHILLYLALSAVVILVLIIYFPQIKMVLFDREFARSMQVCLTKIDLILITLLLFAIVIGMRSAGVVLLAGLLIAPPLAAKQYTSRLSYIFVLSGFFGLLSAFLGNYFSITLPYLFLEGDGRPFSLPTGPMILLIGSTICFISLFFAPESGIFFRKIRSRKFRLQCQMENVLKLLRKETKYSAKEIKRFFTRLFCFLFKPKQLDYRCFCKIVSILMGTIHMNEVSAVICARKLWKNKWVEIYQGTFSLSDEGMKRADKVIELHRLFAMYLVQYLGQRTTMVKKAAQQMEHILTQEMEKEITDFLEKE